MSLGRSLDKLEEVADGADLVTGEGLDREVACDDQNNGRVEVVRQEAVRCQV